MHRLKPDKYADFVHLSEASTNHFLTNLVMIFRSHLNDQSSRAHTILRVILVLSRCHVCLKQFFHHSLPSHHISIRRALSTRVRHSTRAKSPKEAKKEGSKAPSGYSLLLSCMLAPIFGGRVLCRGCQHVSTNLQISELNFVDLAGSETLTYEFGEVCDLSRC